MNEQAQPRSGDSTERDPFFQAVNMLRQQDTTAQQAAERFARPIEESADPGCLLDTNAWDPIHEAMIKTSDADGYRDKLFEMLLCLKTRPAVDLAGRSKTGAVSDQAGLKLWSDLPGYSWTLSDLAWWYHDSRWREEPAEYGSREKREQVANIAALEARLTACGLSDFSIECYERLSDILEDEHASLDIELPAVRETLVAAARQGIEDGHLHSAIARSRRLYRGPGGVHEDRWAFWTERLDSLGRDETLAVQTRAAAREAWDAIQEMSGQGEN